MPLSVWIYLLITEPDTSDVGIVTSSRIARNVIFMIDAYFILNCNKKFSLSIIYVSQFNFSDVVIALFMKTQVLFYLFICASTGFTTLPPTFIHIIMKFGIDNSVGPDRTG